jgi:hypothetical protein
VTNITNCQFISCPDVVFYSSVNLVNVEFRNSFYAGVGTPRGGAVRVANSVTANFENSRFVNNTILG